MIKSRLTLTLLGACAVLAVAWPFRTNSICICRQNPSIGLW